MSVNRVKGVLEEYWSTPVRTGADDDLKLSKFWYFFYSKFFSIFVINGSTILFSKH